MLNIAIVVTTTLVIFILCSQSLAKLLNKLQLPSPLTGPDSLAFDRNGGGPYVGSSDGRIFKYIGPDEGFKEFAYTYPNISRDGSFVLVSKYLSNRILRVWLKGPRANSLELLMLLAGSPDNIKKNSRGQFWISVNSYLGSPSRTILPGGVRVSENGLILQNVSLGAEYGTQPVSEIQEYNQTLYGGSLIASYASIFIP